MSNRTTSNRTANSETCATRATRVTRATGAFAVAIGLAGAVAGCLGGPSTSSSPTTVPTVVAPSAVTPPTTLPTAVPSPTVEPAAFPRNPAPYVEGAAYAQVFNPADFVAGIDNPFLPFTPGARFVFDGDEHVEVEVLAETKQILGIAATVVRDQVFDGDELIEDTLDWYAQDRDGNVWYMGEQTAEYENGKVSSTAGSWEGGVDGAQPGIVMLADPQAGDTYRQEFYAGEAEDVAAITAVTGEVTVPAGTWSGADVLVTEEWTPLEPDVRERKTYARGYGVVEIRTVKGGDEMTTLTSMTTASLA
ncbi:MAG TPA: hypothetical protein VIF63_05365, partial [Candidatus Limnocylindrales bacterium]